MTNDDEIREAPLILSVHNQSKHQSKGHNHSPFKKHKVVASLASNARHVMPVNKRSIACYFDEYVLHQSVHVQTREPNDNEVNFFD